MALLRSIGSQFPTNFNAVGSGGSVSNITGKLVFVASGKGSTGQLLPTVTGTYGTQYTLQHGAGANSSCDGIILTDCDNVTVSVSSGTLTVGVLN